MDDVRVVTAEEPTVAPAAPPATKAAASAPKRLVVDEQKEIKKEEEDTEEVFTGTIVKPFTGTIVKPTKGTVPFTGTIVKHAVKPTETVTEQEGGGGGGGQQGGGRHGGRDDREGERRTRPGSSDAQQLGWDHATRPLAPTDQPGHDIPGRITGRRARGDRRDGAAIEPEGPARPRIPITSLDQSRRIGH